MPELPPQSRVTSRIDGNVLRISIPRPMGRLGCLGGSWSLAAIFGFLTVCSFAQGIFSGNRAWTAAGFCFFIITAWQLLALRGGLLRSGGAVKIEISPDSLSRFTGPADVPHKKSWPRSAITDIRVEPKSSSGPASLNLHIQGEPDAVCLFCCDDPEELEWIYGQIRLRLGR